MATAPPLAPFDTCMIYTAREPSSSGAHVAACTAMGPVLRGPEPMAPPVGGVHYDQWANFERYTAPVPWGFLVHAMEHGAIVMAYRCEPGPECTSVRAQLEAMIDAQPVDPLCRDDVRRRFVLVPEPALAWPIAVLAWENIYMATCVDSESIHSFVRAHYARGPENFCASGVNRASTLWCD